MLIGTSLRHRTAGSRTCIAGLAALALALMVAAAEAAPGTPDADFGLDVWTAEDGLPQNVIRAIHQTEDGYLWLTTLDGLVRFDGVRFTVFDRASAPGIGSNRFTPMYEDRDGALWLGSEAAGVTRYTGGDFATYGIAEGLPDNHVTGITGDDEGNVWMLAGGRIVRWDDGRVLPVAPDGVALRFRITAWNPEVFWAMDAETIYRFTRGRLTTSSRPDSLTEPANIAEDASGTLWIADADGTVTRLDDPAAPAIPHVADSPAAPDGGALATGLEATVAHRDRQGRLWRFRVDRWLQRTLTVASAGHRHEVRFTTFFEDREGSLWLGTDGGGLYRIRDQAARAYSRQHGLIGRNVYPILQDRSGAIWIGTRDAGLSRYEDGRFANFTVDDGLASPGVTALAEDRDGRLWVATRRQTSGGLRIWRDGRFVPVEHVTLPGHATVAAIHHDAMGRTWIGTTLGLVRHVDGVSTWYTIRNGLAGDDVKVVIDDGAGGVWVGSYGGLTHIRGGRITSWTEAHGLPSNSVRALYLDADGVLWIGTYDGGLGRLAQGRLTAITARGGLFNNGVFQILEDDAGHLWMSCNRGIYRVSKEELHAFAAGRRPLVSALALGRRHGLLSAEANGAYWPAGIRARDGSLWFPTQDGVVVIEPDRIAAEQDPVPAAIETIRSGRDVLPVADEVRLAPRQNTFEIEYTGLRLRNADWIRFRYRLAGLDEDWVDAGTRRTAYYSHVPPGDYTFTVVAGTGDGRWSAGGADLRIVVVPRFWQTRWFVGLAIVSAISMVTLLYQRRVTALERARAAQQAFSRRLIAS